jgi:hypothetical protein
MATDLPSIKCLYSSIRFAPGIGDFLFSKHPVEKTTNVKMGIMRNILFIINNITVNLRIFTHKVKTL